MGITRMALMAGLIGVTGVTVTAVQQKSMKIWNFETDKAGEIATGFTSETGEWKIVADEAAPTKPHAFAQLAKSDEKTFNIALLTEPVARNIDLRVKFRVVSGEIDQGGGLIWRAKDAKNYYLCRYNPLESNIRVYKVIDGVRTIIHSVEDVMEATGWQTMRIVTNGTRLEGHLNGEARFSIINEALTEAGKVGLWSKADARTHFDDLELEVMDR